MSFEPFRSTSAVLLALVVAACGGAESDGSSEAGATAEVAPAPSLSVATELGVRNARSPVEGLVSAGQPSQEQIEALAEAGYRNFISLRPMAEDGAGWEEAHATIGGYDFDRLPISGGADLTRENVEAFAAMLEAAGDEPTVVYCASSNRVGAMLALKAHWIDGVAPEEALELGLAGGMTRLEGPVRELLGLGSE